TAMREGEEGTRWNIDETNAKHVRVIYERKRNGDSLVAIARYLNEQGIPPPRKPRNANGPSYWRPGTVYQLIRNPIYRGVFVWNGSSFAKAKAKKEKVKLEEIEFL